MNGQEPIAIGTRREVFWDDDLVERTDAVLTQHKPVDRGVAMRGDAPWEGSSCVYPSIVRDGAIIRLYYKAGDFKISEQTRPGDPLTGPMVQCCAESYDDGRTFQKPDYGIYDYPGSPANNIILMTGETIHNTDNLAVFKDPNPDCPEDERFKATLDNGPAGGSGGDHVLCWLKSADGVHFEYGGEVLRGGWFDSMNGAFWDRHSRQYFLYMRDWPEGYPRSRGEGMSRKKRAVRYSVSADFRHWSEPRPVIFDADDEVELYTSNIKPYPRSDRLFLGLATRYVEREGWSPSFDHLPNRENRVNRSRVQMRYGTALTDCVLITSRDGIHFKRWNEAFLTPGIERGFNWVYGDCYCSWGLVETPVDFPETVPNEWSFYAFEQMWQQACVLRRYAIRKDGLISMRTGLGGASLLTKPLIHEGQRLMLNFATSAVGSIRVTLLDAEGHEIPGYRSHEVFGDNLDRPVEFVNGTDLSALAGRPIRIRFDMRDADLYACQFVSPNLS